MQISTYNTKGLPTVNCDNDLPYMADTMKKASCNPNGVLTVKCNNGVHDWTIKKASWNPNVVLIVKCDTCNDVHDWHNEESFKQSKRCTDSEIEMWYWYTTDKMKIASCNPNCVANWHWKVIMKLEFEEEKKMHQYFLSHRSICKKNTFLAFCTIQIQSMSINIWKRLV